jgi:hypothetical protein
MARTKPPKNPQGRESWIVRLLHQNFYRLLLYPYTLPLEALSNLKDWIRDSYALQQTQHEPYSNRMGQANDKLRRVNPYSLYQYFRSTSIPLVFPENNIANYINPNYTDSSEFEKL